MSMWVLVLIAVSLAMDAFAVSVAKGHCFTGQDSVKKIGMPFMFGVFQTAMPLIGWFVGAQLTDMINSYDHWIIFGLLAYLGINMIRNSKKAAEEENEDFCELVSWREIIMLAFATSLDALAIGLTFAFMDVNVWGASSLIGVVAFIISLVGVFLGQQLKRFLGGREEVLGGIVLIVIGLKVLLQHMQII